MPGSPPGCYTAALLHLLRCMVTVRVCVGAECTVCTSLRPKPYRVCTEQSLTSAALPVLAARAVAGLTCCPLGVAGSALVAGVRSCRSAARLSNSQETLAHEGPLYPTRPLRAPGIGPSHSCIRKSCIPSRPYTHGAQHSTGPTRLLSPRLQDPRRVGLRHSPPLPWCNSNHQRRQYTAPGACPGSVPFLFASRFMPSRMLTKSASSSG